MSKHSWQLHVSAVVVSEQIWIMEPFRGIYAYIQLANLKEIPLRPMANQEPTVATDEALQFYCVWLCLWSNYTSRSEMARFQTRKHSHLLTIKFTIRYISYLTDYYGYNLLFRTQQDDIYLMFLFFVLLLIYCNCVEKLHFGTFYYDSSSLLLGKCG